MRQVQTIFHKNEDLLDLQKILNIQEGLYEEAGPDETIAVFSADFGEGIEADIKVCNGDTPYVDAVLFDKGSEVVTSPEVGDTLIGRYDFEYEDKVYIVYVLPVPSYQNMDKTGILQLLDAYDDYIQNANEQDEYEEGVRPLLMDDYYDIRLDENGKMGEYNLLDSKPRMYAGESKETLLSLAAAYNQYIQDANKENRYQSRWMPVSLNEFWEVEYD